MPEEKENGSTNFNTCTCSSRFHCLQVAFQVGDIVGLFTKDTEGAKLHGATALELSTVVIGKIAHFGLLLAPLANHATSAVLAGIASFVAVQGMVLACTFAVSHNVAEAKVPEDTGGEAWERDWGVQQLVTSADWGGRIGNFFHRWVEFASGAPLVPGDLLRPLPSHCENCQRRGGKVWRELCELPHVARYIHPVYEICERYGDC